MRTLFPFLCMVVSSGALGCAPTEYTGFEDRRLAHGGSNDAGTVPTDGAVPPMHDAAVVPGVDAWMPPGSDAGVMPGCATYTADVQPIYVRHCASCHTTGREPHFGSSYTVAIRTTSSCRTPMPQCTIQLGRPGGSMAREDRLGGFSAAEIATIQSWIDCGTPM